MPNRGIGLIELVISVVIGAIVTGAIVYSYSRLDRSGAVQTRSQELEIELAELSRHMLEIGRFSQGCSNPGTAGDTILQCSIDFERPPVGNLTDVRFIYPDGSDEIRYEINESGSWVTKRTFGARNPYRIASFVVCDAASMGAVPSCPLEPTKMSVRRNALQNSNQLKIPPIDISERFIRFQIAARLDEDSQAVRIQNAFYARNPPPDSSISYQWGTLNQ